MLAIVLLMPAVMAVEEPVSVLRVYPETVSLTDARDDQRLLVLQKNPDGSTVDITASAEFSVDVDGLVKIESVRCDRSQMASVEFGCSRQV